MSEPWRQEKPKTLSPEEIILWLESYRELMMEIWKNNPELYEEWKKIQGK